MELQEIAVPSILWTTNMRTLLSWRVKLLAAPYPLVHPMQVQLLQWTNKENNICFNKWIFYETQANTHVIFVYVSTTSHPQNEAPLVGWWRCFLLRPLNGGRKHLFSTFVLTFFKVKNYMYKDSWAFNKQWRSERFHTCFAKNNLHQPDPLFNSYRSFILQLMRG